MFNTEITFVRLISLPVFELLEVVRVSLTYFYISTRNSAWHAWGSQEKFIYNCPGHLKAPTVV